MCVGNEEWIKIRTDLIMILKWCRDHIAQNPQYEVQYYAGENFVPIILKVADIYWDS